MELLWVLTSWQSEHLSTNRQTSREREREGGDCSQEGRAPGPLSLSEKKQQQQQQAGEAGEAAAKKRWWTGWAEGSLKLGDVGSSQESVWRIRYAESS
mmetsp:Transcript_8245/g.25504  ORF Transcript_8245/g.25504 Transcript_8245/m.25504 type:complete len:98 (+) Transcript_8245:73-366(+)